MKSLLRKNCAGIHLHLITLLLCALFFAVSAQAAEESAGKPDELAKEGDAAKQKPVEPDLPPEKAPPVIKEGPTDGRVLPPRTDKLLEATFGQMAPRWTLKAAKIEKKTVEVTLCDAQQACSELTLSDPKANCAGEKVGAWCVTWKSQPDEAGKKTAHDALAKASDSAVWSLAKHKAAGGHVPGQGPAENLPEGATGSNDANRLPSSEGQPPAEMDDPSLLLLLAAAFGVLIAAIALFRMKGEDGGDDAAADGDSQDQ